MVLENGLAWRAKEMKKFVKLRKSASLSKLRPVTGGMQEKRKPREWNDENDT